MGDETPIAYLSPEERYVEKLATPDVTIADMIGDIDPIKAAKRGARISASELTVHYGLLPRANRGIFAVNELPDLAGKIQVGLFNIMQEGDVQIKGYPVRLPLDVMLVFTRQSGGLHRARQDHHPAEGPHRQRDPHALSRDRRAGHRDHRAGSLDRARIAARTAGPGVHPRGDRADGVPGPRRQAGRQALRRQSSACRSRVLENVISNAERRALRSGETLAVPRICDIYAALPSITGKLELEYEGELKGGDSVARELIRAAVAQGVHRLLRRQST